MEKILFPTDFSDMATLAYRYCLKVAQQVNAPVEVLHVYRGDFGVPVPEVMAYKLLEERKLASEKRIETFAALGETDTPLTTEQQANISTSIEMGLATDVIVERTQDDDVDLIVMGTKGEHNLVEVVFGSVTSATINRAACPVLAVPENVEFNAIKKIAFATDLSDQSIEQLDEVITWANKFNAELHYVFVKTDSSPVDEARVEELLEAQTNGLAATYHQVKNPHVAQGINNFIEQEGIDLLIMHHPQKGFFQRLFTASETRQMAFRSKVPLLVWR
ncbi:MAG: universal stress protein [Aureispira sp.]|nr:universal stress protein [Aureispira sp.]